MATEKLYIAKLETGEEIGPAEQEVLVKLAEEGTITSTTMVRSKLIPEWNKAGSVDFLKAIIFKQQQEKMEEIAANQPLFKRIKERMFLEAPVMDDGKGLVKVKVETLPQPDPLMRILAGVIDLVILVILAAAILFGAKMCRDNGVLSPEQAVYIGIPAIVAMIPLYFTLLISLNAQTVGQKFWGIFLIRKNGGQLRCGRVFMFSVLVSIFGILAPVFFLLHTKTYPELLTGTRFAKVLTKKKN